MEGLRAERGIKSQLTVESVGLNTERARSSEHIESSVEAEGDIKQRLGNR